MDAKTYAIFKKISSGGCGSDPFLQDKEVLITENGETIVEADLNYDGLSSVEITTNIPEPSGTIGITNTSLIDVSSYANAQIMEPDLLPEYIKKGIDILGVTGVFEGDGQSFEYDIIEYTVTTDSQYANPGTLYTIPHGLNYTPTWFVAVQVPHSAIVNGRALYWTSVGGESGMITSFGGSQISFWTGYSRESDIDKRAYADENNFYVRSKEWAFDSITAGSTIYVITKNMGV